MAIFFLAMPVFLSLVLWEALARSTQLDRGRVLMAHWRRTELVVSTLLGMHSKSSEQLLTSMSWRRCVLPHGFSVFFHLKVSWQLISRVSLSATCAVTSWFEGVCECGQTTCSTELFVVKAVWCSLKVFPPLPYGIVSAVRPLKGKRNWPFQPPESTSTSNRRRALFVLPSRCKWGWHAQPKS